MNDYQIIIPNFVENFNVSVYSFRELQASHETLR